MVKKEDLKVGLFFYVEGRLVFEGCSMLKAENYGDFLIYPESHYDVWNRFRSLNADDTIPYDYYPRGRVVYRKSDETFIIYYDRCIESELGRLFGDYESYNHRFELDEHYCCHKCSPDYVML